MERLRRRQVEMRDTIGARALAVAELTGAEEPGYAEGLRAAISAAVDYGLEAIEGGTGRSESVPPATLVQARVAARSGVELAVVVRRYTAGYSVLCESLGEELRQVPAAASLFAPMQGELTAAFNRLITEVSAEYQREAECLTVPPIGRQAIRVTSLLEGEKISCAELGYGLCGWHLAAVAKGDGAVAVVRRLTAGLGRRSLIVEITEREAWAWFGGREPPNPAPLVARGNEESDSILVGVGEPGRDVSGWRASHSQAQTALSVAVRGPGPVIRYADVALVSAVLDDEDLTNFLMAEFLEPLTAIRGSDEVLRGTLRAFLASGRNASSAAAALGVARQTVTSRVRVIEQALARPIDSCAAELEVALRIAPFLEDIRARSS